MLTPVKPVLRPRMVMKGLDVAAGRSKTDLYMTESSLDAVPAPQPA